MMDDGSILYSSRSIPSFAKSGEHLVSSIDPSSSRTFSRLVSPAKLNWNVCKRFGSCVVM